MQEQRARRPSGFGWAFAAAFLTIPTLILLGLSAGFAADSSEWLTRMDHVPGGERFVTGLVQVSGDRPLLMSPGAHQPCVAWETAVGVSWSTRNQNDEKETDSKVLRASGAASRFVVVDARAGVVATIDAPRLQLLGPAASGALDAVPGWADDFEVKGSDVSRPDGYWWTERTLAPGATVTFFTKTGALAAPLDGHARLVVFPGTPEAWRSELEGMASAAKWTFRVALVLGPLAVSCLVMFVVRRFFARPQM